MSRLSLIEKLYAKKKSIFEFNYDALWAPNINDILTVTDVGDLYYIATSLRYSANIDKKYELIDEIMKRRGFKKAHAGTNRVVYNFLDLQTFVAKIAIDKVGIKDTPAEFLNQAYIRPFCCKIFECDPTGVCGFVERVNPVSSIHEFLSINEDVFNMMMWLLDKGIILDDVGAEYYMNYGVRQYANGAMFGPVLIDFPYMYNLDGNKLVCANKIKTPFGSHLCGGEIDFTPDLSHIICTKCGKTYTARDLHKPDTTIKMFGANGEEIKMIRAKIIDMKTNRVVIDTGRSNNVIENEDELNFHRNNAIAVEVEETIRSKRNNREQNKQNIINNIYDKYNKELEEANNRINKNAKAKKVDTIIDADNNNTFVTNIIAEVIDELKNDKKIDYDEDEINIVEEYNIDEEPEVTYDLEGEEGIDPEEYIAKYGEDYNGYEYSEPTMEEIEASAIPELKNQVDDDDASASIMFNGVPLKDIYYKEFNGDEEESDDNKESSDGYLDEY